MPAEGRLWPSGDNDGGDGDGDADGDDGGDDDCDLFTLPECVSLFALLQIPIKIRLGQTIKSLL